MNQTTVAVASDHRGFLLKSLLLSRLRTAGYTLVDYGADDETSCDAGDHALRVVSHLKEFPDHLGILICGSGQAMAMTANRHQHIRAALCLNTTMAKLSREHNDANVIVLGAHIIGQEVALDSVDTFLGTSFLSGRYLARRDKLTALGGL